MSAQLNLPPRRCSRCSKAKRNDGKPIAVHWSTRFERWICLACTFQMAEVVTP